MIMKGEKSPFQVGQLVETKSFLRGYRGAWFKCKIKKINRRRDGELWMDLEYCDFPDEKIIPSKLYQKPQIGGTRTKEPKRELMLRPCYPCVYHENQMPDICSISEVAVIVRDSWKVGDLVDWWSDGCYWCGTVTDALADEKFQIELLPPPYGEGSAYEAFSKDLRPSLDWSPDDGWTALFPKAGENGACARIISPLSQGATLDLVVGFSSEGQNVLDATTETSVDRNFSYSSNLSASLLPSQHNVEQVKQPSIATPEEIETSGRKIGTMEQVTRQRSITTPEEIQTSKRKIGTMEQVTKKPSITTPEEIQTSERKIGTMTAEASVDQSITTPEEIQTSERKIGTMTAEASIDQSLSDTSHVPASLTAPQDAVKQPLSSAENNSSLKRTKVGEGISLNSISPGTVESAIVDMEELLNRVKWVKQILKSGMPSSNTAQPSWKFVDHRAPSTSK